MAYRCKHQYSFYCYRALLELIWIFQRAYNDKSAKTKWFHFEKFRMIDTYWFRFENKLLIFPQRRRIFPPVSIVRVGKTHLIVFMEYSKRNTFIRFIIYKSESNFSFLAFLRTQYLNDTTSFSLSPEKTNRMVKFGRRQVITHLKK